MRIKLPNTDPFWNLHSHSRYSFNDALPKVSEMVETVAAMQQPALGLTDHGNMAGSVQLYQHCKKAGIKPFPGTELYVVDSRANKKAKRRHMCVVAFTTEGYENLVNLSTLSHRNFHHKPLVDLADLAELSESGKTKGLAATSGCYFGMITSALVEEKEGLAKTYLSSFAQWFDRFYVELQSHNITHDDGWTDQKIIDRLIDMADQLGLPCVITQDAHYCHLADKEAHETLKRLVAYGPDGDDAVFPGDGFHLADSDWIESHHTPRAIRRGFEGLSDLLDAHTLTIKELDNYHYTVPFTVADPDQELRKYCEQELEERNLGDRHRALLQEELEVITESRMAGYLLTVKEVTDYCRENQIFTQARGSASGSLVCWLLGITQVDPIHWDLRYERFISRDRTKPPDIDLDVEHSKREALIAWLNERFAVNQIGTWSTYSLSGAEDGKGSLRVKYFARRRAQGKEIGGWDQVPIEDRKAMWQLSDRKLLSGCGTHAAGLVVTTTQADFSRLVPLMYIASSKTFVTQYFDDDIESLGLVKMDILGLNTLSILNKAMSDLERDGLDWIPLKDSDTFKFIRKGYTDGIFQLEGNTTRRGVRELKPSKIDDIVAAMALFRTAPLKTGATESFINRKHKKERIPQRHEIINRVTASTQGIMLYQEQVIDILRALDMSVDDLNVFLKAIKASNKDIGNAGNVIKSYEEKLRVLCSDKGMTDDDYKKLWQDIEGFAEYGFNKAHSVAYGITAYRCGYLAAHYPLEFYAAVLNISAGTPKESGYVRAARYRGLSVRPAHVNSSGVSYEVDARLGCIRRGLLAIKGVGAKAALEIIEKRPSGGYVSLDDFCERVSHRKITGVKAYLTEQDPTVGTFGKLYEAEAFKGLDGIFEGRSKRALGRNVRGDDSGRSGVDSMLEEPSRDSSSVD